MSPSLQPPWPPPRRLASAPFPSIERGAAQALLVPAAAFQLSGAGAGAVSLRWPSSGPLRWRGLAELGDARAASDISAARAAYLKSTRLVDDAASRTRLVWGAAEGRRKDGALRAAREAWPPRPKTWTAPDGSDLLAPATYAEAATSVRRQDRGGGGHWRLLPARRRRCTRLPLGRGRADPAEALELRPEDPEC